MYTPSINLETAEALGLCVPKPQPLRVAEKSSYENNPLAQTWANRYEHV
jgi:hypothetical protein